MDYDIMDIDMPMLIGSAFLMWFVLADFKVSLFEAILMLIGLAIFLINSLTGNVPDEMERPRTAWRDPGSGLV